MGQNTYIVWDEATGEFHPEFCDASLEAERRGSLAPAEHMVRVASYMQGDYQLRADAALAAEQEQIAEGLPATAVPLSAVLAPRAKSQEESAEALAQARRAAADRVDRAAEKIRGLFITLGSGQAMVYQAKMAEAELVIAASDPEAVPESIIPHVFAEAARNGMTRFDTALTIFNLGESWKQISAGIETIRLGAKQAIADAQTVDGVGAAAQPDWSPILAYAS